ncbi:hypothetical protein [Haloprofundus sp. MHR1]|uniref:hypothetical protein n=1 Tax=Haloprofundus sp. MHR1 TaxID=2572921 RepID=UPI0010BF518B|nr:hypothetical protein [Haloprofundus sp. MHR1]QCJ45749.1 hypothetical protein FCF25_00820 [Haloprofundus sp. MHR1]
MSEADETAVGVTRRELVRAAASGSGTTTVGPAFVVNPDERQGETVTAEVAAGSEPTPEGADYTGRLVHVVGRVAETDTDAASGGQSRSVDGDVRRYEVVVVDPAAGGVRATRVDLLVLGPSTLRTGSLFAVENHRREGGRTRLSLERISARRGASNLSETAHAAVDSSVERRGATTAGVGAVSTLVGLAAVVYAFGRRMSGR